MVRAIILFLLLVALDIRVYRAEPAALAVGLGWAMAVSAGWWWMERRGKLPLYRQLYFALLAVFFLMAMHLPKGMGRDFTPYCHLALAGNAARLVHTQFLAFAGGTWAKFGALSLGVLWLAVVLAVGGGFCSWVCFFGGVDDGMSRLPRKPILRIPGFIRPREFQLVLLAFLAFISFTQMEPEFCRWLCPFKLKTEILDPSDRAYVFQVGAFAAVGILFLVVVPLLTGKRAFCSAICPFGAIPPLLRWLNPHRVSIEKGGCKRCGACADACPSFAIERNGGKYGVNRYCTSCLRCVPACPRGGIHLTMAGRKEGRFLPFVSLCLGGALSMFYVPAGVLALARVAAP